MSHLEDRIGNGFDSQAGQTHADILQMLTNSLIVVELFNRQALELIGLFDQPAQRGKTRGTLVRLSVELTMLHGQVTRAAQRMQQLHDELYAEIGSLGIAKWP